MGVLLSKPNTEKEFDEGGNAKLQYAACSMQGWRTTMEDAHTAELDIDGKGSAFFGVFDGHAGTDVAIYSSKYLYTNLTATAFYKGGQYEKGLHEAFLKTDADLRTEAGHIECQKIRRELARSHDDGDDEGDDRDSGGLTESGSTAVTCLLVGNDLYCANAGDSRAVLCRDGVAVNLSEDHKPMNEEEKLRIEKAGGFVEDKRVNGTLAVARALGDFSFKTGNIPAEEQQVTCNPEIKKFQVQDKDEFVILACDGIWDVVTSQQAVDLVRERIRKGMGLKEILSELFDQCLSPHPSANEGLGCDNMTAIIVQLKK